MKLETMAVHAGYSPDPATRAVAVRFGCAAPAFAMALASQGRLAPFAWRGRVLSGQAGPM